jgi:hypothetical protein
MAQIPMNRRDFMRTLAVMGMVSFAPTAAQAAKLAQEKVQYQETPKDGNVCRDCMHFLPENNTCRLVAGTINPEGWCQLYVLPPNKR